VVICRGIEISGLPLLHLRGGRGKRQPGMKARYGANKKMPDFLQFPRSGKAALQETRHAGHYTLGWSFRQIGPQQIVETHDHFSHGPSGT